MTVESVNIGRPATIGANARGPVTSAIGKVPALGRIAVRGVNIDGDDQADREVHGGADRAVYAYGAEDYAWWASELGRALEPGTFGENLTTRGYDVNAAVVGERWHFGSGLELEISIPRVPCYKLAMRIGDPAFVKRFGAALRPGPYLRIATEGTIAAGDAFEVRERPAHGITIAHVYRIYMFERDRLAELLAAPQLGAGWIGWIEDQLRSASTRASDSNPSP